MVIPQYITLSDWADSLIIDFPNDDILILNDEDEWKDWGEHLVQEDSFVRNNAPSPEYYEDWITWARDIFLVMSNNSI